MTDQRDEQQHIKDEIEADSADELSADDRLLLAAFEREVRESGRIPVQLNVSWEVAWAILCTIQLACRHPEFIGQTRKVAEGFGRYLEQQITIGPVSAQIAARGWDGVQQLGDVALGRVEQSEPGEYGPLAKEQLV